MNNKDNITEKENTTSNENLQPTTATSTTKEPMDRWQIPEAWQAARDKINEYKTKARGTRRKQKNEQWRGGAERKRERERGRKSRGAIEMRSIIEGVKVIKRKIRNEKKAQQAARDKINEYKTKARGTRRKRKDRQRRGGAVEQKRERGRGWKSRGAIETRRIREGVKIRRRKRRNEKKAGISKEARGDHIRSGQSRRTGARRRAWSRLWRRWEKGWQHLKGYGWSKIRTLGGGKSQRIPEEERIK